VVLDCGANQGEFAAWVSDKTKARIHAFEPDPRLYGNLPRIANAQFWEAAVWHTPGMVRLALGDGQESSVCFAVGVGRGVEVVAVTLADFCRDQRIEAVALLKLDIEGAEVPVLMSLEPQFLARIVQITVEFHDFVDSAEAGRIRQVIQRLRRLGFLVFKFSWHDYSDVLLVNAAYPQLNKFYLLTAVWAYKYLRGCRRILERPRRFCVSAERWGQHRSGMPRGSRRLPMRGESEAIRRRGHGFPERP